LRFRRKPEPALPVGVPAWADVLASIEDGIVVLGADGTVLEMNPAAEQLTGVSAGVARGGEAATVVAAHPDNAWLAELVGDALREGAARRRGEGVLVARRTAIPVRAACAPVLAADGTLSGAVLVLEDLTLQQSLEATTRRAERIGALGTVAVGLAHEIRNPLAGMKGAAQLLRGALADPDQVRCTDVIIREVERLDGLVEQLRELTVPPELQLAAVNIHRVLNDVLTLERETPAWGRIALRKRFDPSLPPVHGDAAQLVQVFLNLVRNAVEALDGAGEIHLVTRIESRFHVRRRSGRGRFLQVAVEDTGPGVADTDEAHLFSPFFTTKTRGSGLGLAVCHRIVSRHGGTITHEPRPGGGAIFIVTLPVSEHDVESG
jgi:two-component system nitrogen regulation sensor histidine kinase GlnL